MTHWTDRLDGLVAGDATPPDLVQYMKLGTLDRWSPGEAVKTWAIDPLFCHGDGTVFGGYLAALADQTATFAAMTVMAEDRAFRTHQLTMDYLRLAKGRVLTVTGRVTNHGASLLHIGVEMVRDDGKPAVRAQAIMAITAFPS